MRTLSGILFWLFLPVIWPIWILSELRVYLRDYSPWRKVDMGKSTVANPLGISKSEEEE